MPIKPENLARYPKNWKEIRASILERAENKCEWINEYGERCVANNHERGYWDGDAFVGLSEVGLSQYDGYAKLVTIVLTIAHLGIPAALPFHLHMTGITETNKVLRIVGFGMSTDAKHLERDNVMDDRALTDFLAATVADRAGFFIALPNNPPGLIPGRPVVGNPDTAPPVWVRLTSFRLLDKPSHPTGISAEPSPQPKIVSADGIGFPAHLTDGAPDPAFRPTEMLAGADIGTSSLPIERLLSGDGEDVSTDNASFFTFAASGYATNSRELMPNSPLSAEKVPAFYGASFANGIKGCRCWKHLPASYTHLFSGAESWSRHTLIIPCQSDLDHQPENNDPKNLMAMCQLHHNRYDIAHRAETRKRTMVKAGRGSKSHMTYIQLGLFEYKPEEPARQCPDCGSIEGGVDGSWRYVDGRYEHKCPNKHPQLGHYRMEEGL